MTSLFSRASCSFSCVPCSFVGAPCSFPCSPSSLPCISCSMSSASGSLIVDSGSFPWIPISFACSCSLSISYHCSQICSYACQGNSDVHVLSIFQVSSMPNPTRLPLQPSPCHYLEQLLHEMYGYVRGPPRLTHVQRRLVGRPLRRHRRTRRRPCWAHAQLVEAAGEYRFYGSFNRY